MIQSLEIKTQEDLDTLLSFINDCKKCIYEENGFDLSTMEDKYRKQPWIKHVINYITAGKVGDKGMLGNSLNDLEEYVKKIEKVVINMPYIPSRKFLERIYSDLKPIVRKEFIIVPKQDDSISIGARLFCEGTFIDLSLKSRVLSLINKDNVIGKYL